MLIASVIFFVSLNELANASGHLANPITDINFFNVKKVVAPPLIIFENPFDVVFLNNTGRSVQLNVNEPVSANIATGSALGFGKYVFAKTVFHWAKSAKEAAYTTVNGRFGTALEIHIIYYNVRYGSFENALKHPDGLAIVSFRIKVGLLRNPLFDLFAPYFTQIRKPGSSVRLLLAPAFLFYSVTFPTDRYFVYHGSYVDEKTGKAYDCATYFITPLSPLHFISEKQFEETFLSLRGLGGRTLINKVGPVPQGSTKVQQSIGILKIPNFVPVPTRLRNQ